MNWRRRLGLIAVVACTVVTTWSLATRRPRPDVGPAGERVVRVYDVGDLLDVPVFEPDELEPNGQTSSTTPGSLFGPASGLGTKAPRLFIGSKSSPPPTPQRQRLTELGELLKESVDRGSWGAGRGTVYGLSRRLVVVQARRNHQLISELLAELRASPPRQVSIEVLWARLSSEERARVVVQKGPPDVVDLAGVERVTGAELERGQVTGVSGQWARVRCGRARSVIDEVEVSVDDKKAGFVGQTKQLLDGAAVDLRASLGPPGGALLLEVRAEVTRWVAPELPPIEMPVPLTPGGSSASSVKLDRLNLGVQSIVTSLRGPAEAAIVVGGTTEAERDDGRQLYLIVRVSEVKVGRAASATR